MGLGVWLAEALATVSKTLSGKKRKAPDQLREQEDEQLGILPPPPPPSNERPRLEEHQLGAPRSRGPRRLRGPERLDFSSPAMVGPQQAARQGAHGGVVPSTGHGTSAGDHALPLPSRLGPGPAAARRLSDSLETAAASGAAAAQDSRQPGWPRRQAEAAEGASVPQPGQPLSKRFAPPRVPASHAGTHSRLLSGLKHVREAPPSAAKLGLTPAAQRGWPPTQQQQQQQRHQQSMPGQREPAGTPPSSAGQQQPGWPREQRAEQHPAAEQSQQGQPRRAAGGRSWVQVVQGQRAAAGGGAQSQDAELLRRAVAVTLRQQQQQLAAGGAARRVEEEVDLTRGTPAPQRSQPPRAAPAAAAPDGGVLHWRQLLQRVVLAEEDMGQLEVEEEVQPRDAAGERYGRLVGEAEAAKQRALAAQRREALAAAQAATALERARPQLGLRAEAEAAKLEKQLQEMQLHRKQEAAVQRRAAVAPPQQVLEPVDGEALVVLLSSSEEEGEEEEEEQGSGASLAEGEKSDVSQQLGEASLEEGRPPRMPNSWWREYEEALAPGPDREVLVDHPRSAIQVTRRDMRCMAPGQWLNDEVINLYASLLLERDARRRQQGLGPRCHFFSTFFANKLYKDTGYSYDQVRRWTLPKRLAAAGQASASVLDCDRIVLPVHQGVHWVCAVVDLQRRRLVYYDSLKGEDHTCLEMLARYVRDEYKNKRGEQRDDVLDWPRNFPKDIPRQLNGCDCGVFTLLFANHAGADRPMRFSQGDMDDCRVRVVHELLHMRVE